MFYKLLIGAGAYVLVMATDTASDAGTPSTTEPLHVDGQSQLNDIVTECCVE